MRSSAQLLGLLLGLACACALALAPAASASSRAETAALQVALRAAGLYAGAIDGVAGPATAAGVRALQRRAGDPREQEHHRDGEQERVERYDVRAQRLVAILPGEHPEHPRGFLPDPLHRTLLRARTAGRLTR
ncbi:MAG: peptidoglycan-binding protein [Actinobacteria bacterium]|nr:peptidoglycan-binding protein [Actinomycetota bacterium]